MIISFNFAKFHNFSLSFFPIQNFSAAFWPLSNFRNFGHVICNLWRKIKESIFQLHRKYPFWLELHMKRRKFTKILTNFLMIILLGRLHYTFGLNYKIFVRSL
jgi:hypothetical protein